MIRTVFAIAAIALGVTAAIAQQDPIAARKALMKANGDQGKIGAAMIKGEAPFDLDKAHKVFATFEDASAKALALFPENSIDEATADYPYSASPEIWQNLDDFKARFAKLGADAKAADVSVTDLDSFKAAFGSIRTIAAAATKSIASRRADPEDGRFPLVPAQAGKSVGGID